jgi:chromosome segregation ATPase
MTAESPDNSSSRLDRIEAILEANSHQIQANSHQIQANTREIGELRRSIVDLRDSVNGLKAEIAELMEANQLVVQMFSQQQNAFLEFRRTTRQTLERMERIQQQHGQEIQDLRRDTLVFQQQAAAILNYLFGQQNNGGQSPSQ